MKGNFSDEQIKYIIQGMSKSFDMGFTWCMGYNFVSYKNKTISKSIDDSTSKRLAVAWMMKNKGVSDKAIEIFRIIGKADYDELRGTEMETKEC